jgi:16S rRNA (adenine1518-N6/adenine1519-N6)-dimethyltransferase
MVISPDRIKSRLKQLGIRPDKYLGQHFLIDQTILDQIITTAKDFITDRDTIVEVGPGMGILTEELLKLNQKDVISVEKDPILAKSLPNLIKDDRLKVVQGDILTELDSNPDFQSLDSWVFVANIPYAITSPLIRKLLYRNNPPHHILILVQKESAERITALPGDSRRGLLSLQVEIKAEGTIVGFVSRSSFWPSPEVKSALLLLSTREKPFIPHDEEAHFFRVVQAGFSSKRKQLANSLTGGLQRPKAEVIDRLKQAKIAPVARAEELSVEEWWRLTKILLPSV